MTSVEQFKQDCQRVYEQALDHYGADKEKAQQCVEVYCHGLLIHGAVSHE